MRESSSPEPSGSPAGPSSLAIGVILIVVGLVFLTGQVLDLGFIDLGWPFIIIAVGMGILTVGLLLIPERGVVVAGTIVATVGLVLLYQNATGHWESWAYAWALVGPTASGLGLAVWGLRTRVARDVRNGLWGMLGGLAIFVVGFLFFEAVIGISGQRVPLPEWTLPAAVIAIGVVILLRAVMQRGEPVGE
jgi:vacuolar-type H+-ATPase subunit I/STV1